MVLMQCSMVLIQCSMFLAFFYCDYKVLHSIRNSTTKRGPKHRRSRSVRLDRSFVSLVPYDRDCERQQLCNLIQFASSWQSAWFCYRELLSFYWQKVVTCTSKIQDVAAGRSRQLN